MPRFNNFQQALSYSKEKAKQYSLVIRIVRDGDCWIADDPFAEVPASQSKPALGKPPESDEWESRIQGRKARESILSDRRSHYETLSTSDLERV